MCAATSRPHQCVNVRARPCLPHLVRGTPHASSTVGSPGPPPMGSQCSPAKREGVDLGESGMEEVELHSPFPTTSPDLGLAPSAAGQRAGTCPTFTKTIPTHRPPHPSLGVGRGSALCHLSLRSGQGASPPQPQDLSPALTWPLPLPALAVGRGICAGGGDTLPTAPRGFPGTALRTEHRE